MRLLNKSSFRYLLKHPWQFWLSVTGIALGVSLIVAIDIANESVTKAFSLSMNTVAGKATHQIISASGSMPDSLYRELRVKKGIKNIAPVVEGYVKLDSRGGKIFQLAGIDLFAESAFRDYLNFTTGKVEGDIGSFLTRKNTLLISKRNSELFVKLPGDTLLITANGIQYVCTIAGIINNDEKDVSLENILIADISTAQNIIGEEGHFNYMNAIIEDTVQVQSVLPDGIYIQRSSARSETAEQMLSAFSINLTALSLLALIVGIFLIYNTMSFSVVQRKQLLAILRCGGVTSGEVFMLILKEAALIGVFGTMLGIIGGYYLSSGLVHVISRTINDLYFVVTVTETQTDPALLLKGLFIGFSATLFSALHPAYIASKTTPSYSMLRSAQETNITEKQKYYILTGAVLLAAGIIILSLPGDDIRLSYLGILPVILGFAALTPTLIIFFGRAAAPAISMIFGLTGKIAVGSMVKNLSRTYIAIAALAIAVSASVGVGTMVGSFRTTVVSWLESRLEADLYISAPTLVSRKVDGTISDLIPAILAAKPYTADINFFREVTVRQEGGQYRILGVSMGTKSKDTYIFTDGDAEEIWEEFYRGAVFITEPFAFKHNLGRGMKISIPTNSGNREFTVAGVYYDYASDEGLIVMDYSLLKKYFSVSGISGIALFLKQGSNPETVSQEVRKYADSGQELLIRTNKFLRESSIEVFDRTFLVAYVLQLLTIVVAFAGILSSFMSLQLERSRELGVLRANGFLPSQIFRILTLQTGMMGAVAGLLALPLGTVLAWILVFIINKRSFGWTLQFELSAEIFLQAFILSVIASLLAGIYPGYKMSKVSPAAALRGE